MHLTNMNTLIDMFTMQGYGIYVWGSILITLGILMGNAVYASYQLRCLQKELSNKN